MKNSKLQISLLSAVIIMLVASIFLGLNLKKSLVTIISDSTEEEDSYIIQGFPLICAKRLCMLVGDNGDNSDEKLAKLKERYKYEVTYFPGEGFVVAEDPCEISLVGLFTDFICFLSCLAILLFLANRWQIKKRVVPRM